MTEAERMTVEGWQQVGEVGIDTGRIAIVDPCHLENADSEDYAHCGKTEGGDGTYPVFEFSHDGKKFLAVQLTNVVAMEAIRMAFANKK